MRNEIYAQKTDIHKLMQLDNSKKYKKNAKKQFLAYKFRNNIIYTFNKNSSKEERASFQSLIIRIKSSNKGQ